LVTLVHSAKQGNAIATEKPLKNFFNYGLDEVNPSKSHKLLDFSDLAIWQSIHGLLIRVFFNTLIKVNTNPEKGSIHKSSCPPYRQAPLSIAPGW
jgi:hypothetical protein